MIQNLILAIAAACGSALMFVSVTSGTFISLPLFYLAPLPLMIAALGWGAASATLGAAVAAGALAVVLDLPHAFAYLVIVGVPSIVLGHLALLARGDADDADVLAWYPPGRILFWMAIVAFAIIMIALLTIGFDADAILTALRKALTQMLGDSKTQAGTDLVPLIDALAQATPAATGIVAMLTLIVNFWLAGRIVQMSGRLRRPWPDLRGIAMPRTATFVFVAALILAFTGGLVGLFAQVMAATLAIGFAIAGLSAMHAVSLAWQGRALWLVVTYAIVLMFGWPAVAMSAIGIADSLFDLRARFAAQVQRSPHS